MPDRAERGTAMTPKPKTNLGFVTFLLLAFSRGDEYILGGFGNLLTEAFIDQKCKQYPYNAQNKATLMKNIGKVSYDCYGLLKAYLWDNQNGEGNYVKTQDRNETTAYNAAAEKGDLATIPKRKGIAVWKPDHVGFVVECSAADPKKWLVVEAYNIQTGLLKRTLAEGGWEKWFKDTYLEYIEPVPVPAPVPEPAVDPTTYTIKAGDTFWGISRRLNIPLQDLLDANAGVDPYQLHVGQVIRLPGTTPAVPTYLNHVIKTGDTFWGLSRLYGKTVAEIMVANPGVDPYQLEIGQTVRIPK